MYGSVVFYEVLRFEQAAVAETGALGKKFSCVWRGNPRLQRVKHFGECHCRLASER